MVYDLPMYTMLSFLDVKHVALLCGTSKSMKHIYASIDMLPLVIKHITRAEDVRRRVESLYNFNDGLLHAPVPMSQVVQRIDAWKASSTQLLRDLFDLQETFFDSDGMKDCSLGFMLTYLNMLQPEQYYVRFDQFNLLEEKLEEIRTDAVQNPVLDIMLFSHKVRSALYSLFNCS